MKSGAAGVVVGPAGVDGDVDGIAGAEGGGVAGPVFFGPGGALVAGDRGEGEGGEGQPREGAPATREEGQGKGDHPHEPDAQGDEVAVAPAGVRELGEVGADAQGRNDCKKREAGDEEEASLAGGSAPEGGGEEAEGEQRAGEGVAVGKPGGGGEPHFQGDTVTQDLEPGDRAGGDRGGGGAGEGELAGSERGGGLNEAGEGEGGGVRVV